MDDDKLYFFLSLSNYNFDDDELLLCYYLASKKSCMRLDGVKQCVFVLLFELEDQKKKEMKRKNSYKYERILFNIYF